MVTLAETYSSTHPACRAYEWKVTCIKGRKKIYKNKDTKVWLRMDFVECSRKILEAEVNT
jgi:hypothetical protein